MVRKSSLVSSFYKIGVTVEKALSHVPAHLTIQMVGTPSVALQEEAAKQKKGLKNDIPLKSNKPASFGSHGGRSRGIASQTSKKSPLGDDIFSKMALEEEADAEDPDTSDADPEALLETLKDMDDMEADLLGIKKASSGPVQKLVKNVAKTQPLTELAKSTKTATITEKGGSINGINKNPNSTPTTSRKLKQKLSFEDIDDPLAGLLSDEEEGTAEKAHSFATKSTPETNAGNSKEKGTYLYAPLGHAVIPDRKQEVLMFEGDGDDLMDAMGFGESSVREPKSGRKDGQEESRPARSMLDELLGQGTAKKLLERPKTGEHKEFKLDKKYQKQADKEDTLGDEFTFGAYQPTVASTPEGRQSRRLSVRFSSENLSEQKTVQKPSTPQCASPIRNKTGADWLGLKDNDFDLPPSSPLKESNKTSIKGAMMDMPPGPSDADPPPTPTTQLPSRSKPATKEGALKAEPIKDDDGDSWLSNVLSQKKSRVQEKEKRSGPSLIQGKEGDPIALTSQCATYVQRQQQSVAPIDGPARLEEPRSSIPWLKSQEQTTPAFPSDSRKGTPFGDTSKTAPAVFLQGHDEILPIPVHSQLLHSEPNVLSLPNISEYEKRLTGLQDQLRESLASYQAELLNAQTHVAELEGQVRRLELEKNQQKLLLGSLQQRHQEDLDLIEKAHRNRVKVIEDSYHQREERLRQENQELANQYLSRCQSAEQAKSELLAQHQHRLTELEQEKAKEIDRLQELQRMSILEMRKDHEEQLERLKQLKAQEIDAVTSATSYTRSLNGVINQMEKFSSNLNDLTNKVEATHLTTSQELEIGARQRDEQLRVLQDRLTQQQRDMEEERGRLQEVISIMQARLNEQTRFMEQERWKLAAEQSKVESLQHSLEEQRRVMMQQLSMEKEELERAKNALLDEQKSVMQKCAAERQKLAAEWSELHTQQSLSKQRTEREVDRALQIDSQREGAIMSLAKEQADLKIKANELRSKEEQLARDRVILEQEKQELRLEKEKVSAAALHIKQRTEEINSISKLSSQKYEEGERALLEARKVEAEHQARLRLVQHQMERQKEQEEHLHQERLSLSHQRRKLEQLRVGLPSNPLVFQTTPQVPLSGAQANVISKTNYFSLPDVPKANPGASRGLSNLGPADLYAKLVLHKLTAEQDHDFLEEEQIFLETLKKTSYKTSSQSA
ncbi:fas-binding factor 1 isoform X2 [Rhineura floridana]|uniref:fas-binding factor 1 isoform X2 n=1 Tax=Rhineura floridana TaxID=261503 RepID=UPI002AC837DA|nr:fas-binding factor 1 isoform X2 [Rhineura floridana]